MAGISAPPPGTPRTPTQGRIHAMHRRESSAPRRSPPGASSLHLHLGGGDAVVAEDIRHTRCNPVTAGSGIGELRGEEELFLSLSSARPEALPFSDEDGLSVI